MSARAERAISQKPVKAREVIVNFSPEHLKAPVLLRCGALIIDYIIVIAVPVVGILLSRYADDNPTKLFTSTYNTTSLLVGLLVGLTNFVVFPLFSGQTIGKMLTGLRVVRSDGSAASLSRILVRHLVGYPLTFLTFGLGFLFSFFNREGRALHDFISGTTLVFGRQRRTVKKDTV
jgi:uncharacterized RDD family membrane protein YckC